MAEAVAVQEPRLTSIETRLGTLDGRLTSVESRLRAVDGRLTVVESRLNFMQWHCCRSADCRPRQTIYPLNGGGMRIPTACRRGGCPLCYLARIGELTDRLRSARGPDGSRLRRHLFISSDENQHS